MASRTIRTLAALVAALFACTAARAAAPKQTGAFALYHGTPQIRSQVQLTGHDELDIVQYPQGSRWPLVRYARSEGEPVHVILVRDDFRSFSHVHPRAVGNGHFRVRLALDSGHRFYAFVASQPSGFARQVFRFTLQAGAPPHHLETSLEAPSRVAVAGPYRVALSEASVPAGTPQTIAVAVNKRGGGKAALSSVYGAPAHTVFISPQTLQYVHVDAHAANGRRLALRVPALAPGVYRMWMQLDAGNSSLTAPFTLVAR